MFDSFTLNDFFTFIGYLIVVGGLGWYGGIAFGNLQDWFEGR